MASEQIWKETWRLLILLGFCFLVLWQSQFTLNLIKLWLVQEFKVIALLRVCVLPRLGAAWDSAWRTPANWSLTAAVTAAVMTSPARSLIRCSVWSLLRGRLRPAADFFSVLRLGPPSNCSFFLLSSVGRPRLNSSSSFVPVPFSSDGKSERSREKTSSLGRSRSVKCRIEIEA